MAESNRAEMKTRCDIFDKYTLKDQLNYYEDTVKRNEKALRQVNQIRATLSLLTGLASAAAALVTQLAFTQGAICHKDTIANALAAGELPNTTCPWIRGFMLACIVASIVLPAAGGFFNSLMDLFQWDRLISIYESATENIRRADALSPDDEQLESEYVQSYYDYVHGTLQVMSDETAQWGQSIRAPQSTEKFIQKEGGLADSRGGNAEASRERANKPEDET
jgi:hypothetical protein